MKVSRYSGINCFGSKVEAETFALEIAKAWIDARLTENEPGENKGAMHVFLAPTATQAGNRTRSIVR
jgi:hypothetical protein